MRTKRASRILAIPSIPNSGTEIGSGHLRNGQSLVAVASWRIRVQVQGPNDLGGNCYCVGTPVVRGLHVVEEGGSCEYELASELLCDVRSAMCGRDDG